MQSLAVGACGDGVFDLVDVAGLDGIGPCGAAVVGRRVDVGAKFISWVGIRMKLSPATRTGRRRRLPGGGFSGQFGRASMPMSRPVVSSPTGRSGHRVFCAQRDAEVGEQDGGDDHRDAAAESADRDGDAIARRRWCRP
ncbi:hypothetical protein I553_3538 [Mycobacterium xenopi 4042]|uniref:Uncharacterized protein n=1 Tax=Mycobacterium xenopi 4042 TaxID=1299334 RepID=X8ALQ8_MYCXE|nr:hypothetical protein I553_3538 [Mycobacterium xenopi 4042]